MKVKDSIFHESRRVLEYTTFVEREDEPNTLPTTSAKAFKRTKSRRGDVGEIQQYSVKKGSA